LARDSVFVTALTLVLRTHHVSPRRATQKQCAEILAVARRFFTLLDAAKLEVEMIRSPHFRGYTRIAHASRDGLALNFSRD
jgi:isopenicillin N synthase-like dioxygenase